jgi:ribosome-associated protein
VSDQVDLTPLIHYLPQRRRPGIGINAAMMKQFEIHTPTIDLCDLLKLQGMVSSGGMAKAEIAAGQVKLNGAVETRKRKKIVAGDVVEYAGDKVLVQIKGGRST